MKKLMTMIAAVATAFGLFADETVVSNSTDFSALAVDSLLDVAKDDDGRTSQKPSYWTYSASEVAADALLIGGDDSSKYLAIKTGSETIYRNFAGQESGRQAITTFGAVTEVKDEGLYIDTTLKFLAPLDEIPVAAADTKLVMGLVDETELEITDLTGAGTNLWVIGGYGTDRTPRAYRLRVYAPNGEDAADINDIWLNAKKRVVVKAYNAVAGSDIPGFVINIDGNFCTVLGSAPITEGKVGAYESAGADYLNINKSATGRYGKKQIILSLSATAELQAAGFSGKADMSKIYLGNLIPDGMEEAFVESVEMTVTVGEGVATATATVAGGSAQTLTPGQANTVVFAPGESITVAATFAEKKIPVWTKNDESVEAKDSYTYAFAAGDELTVSAVNSAATAYDVSNEPIGSYATLAEAVAAEDVVKVVLDNNTELEEFIATESTTGLTIDLAGKTISGVSGDEEFKALIKVKDGILNITDSEGAGAITPNTGYDAVVVSGETATLNFLGEKAFNIDGSVTKGEDADSSDIHISAGRFLASANEGLAGIAEFDDDKTLVPDAETGYLIVGIPASTTWRAMVDLEVGEGVIAPTKAKIGEEEVDIVNGEVEDVPNDSSVVVTYTIGEGYTRIGGGETTQTLTKDNPASVAPNAMINTYTITYWDGEKVISGLEPATYTVAAAVSLPTEVALLGGGFKGWYDNPGFTGNAVTQIPAGSTGNTNFYAKVVQVVEQDPTVENPADIPADQTAGSRYGNKVPEALAYVSAKSIASWAQGNGNLEKGKEILENAFLLNCANTEPAINAAKANFKATSITINSDGTVDVGEPTGVYNGTIEKWGKIELDKGEWIKDLDGAKFFELKLVPTNLN